MLSLLKAKMNSYFTMLFGTLYWVLLFALTGVTISLVFQQITNPDKIPHIFGYKLFIVMDEYMTDELEKGDLAITKNIEKEAYLEGNTMAFRNHANLVTIHKIQSIYQRNQKYYFQMEALEGETSDTKYVVEDRIEGKLVKKIPYIGLVLLYIQMPQVMVGVLLFILLCGAVALKIAQKLDERDLKRIQAKEAASQLLI